MKESGIGYGGLLMDRFSFPLKTSGGRDFYCEHAHTYPHLLFMFCVLLSLYFSLYSTVAILLCSLFFLPIRL